MRKITNFLAAAASFIAAVVELLKLFR